MIEHHHLFVIHQLAQRLLLKHQVLSIVQIFKDFSPTDKKTSRNTASCCLRFLVELGH